MPQDHSISWMYQALLTPRGSSKSIQIPNGQFPQAKGNGLTGCLIGPGRLVVARPVEGLSAQEEGLSQSKELILPCS